jgi:hypothetical protein
MRIRSIKPEFWRSDDIDALDWHHRLVFVGLWSYVDDNGVGLDKLASICADLFAGDMERDPVETLNRVSTALKAFAERGLIERYSVEGKAYLIVTGWKRHQRVVNPNKPRYPLPTSENSAPEEDLATSSQDPNETLGTGTGEQGNRGTEEEETSSSAKPPTPEPRSDVEALCTRLRDRIVENGNRPPTITKKWRTEARLLLDKDGIALDKALALIDWCQASSFWKGNILSMPKFREKYDQLRTQAIEEHKRRTASPSTPNLTAREAEYIKAELMKDNPNPEVLRAAGIAPPPARLIALPGGL